MLKQLIKDLAIEQRALKHSRKTGTYKITFYEDWCWPDHGQTPQIVKDSWMAASKVQDNKIRITAALNLYHEMRGSDYRHNVPAYKEYVYKREYEKLKALVNTPKLA